MKTVKDFQLYNKKVLLRADFNVPLDEKGEIIDDFRIVKSLPTIKFLIKQGAKVILISHLGRPSRGKKLSLLPVAEKLSALLDKEVKFVKDTLAGTAQKAVDGLKAKEVILLENLRFHSGEEENDKDFAQKLAQLAELYLNDAFAISHREHASIVGVPKFLPAGAGLLLQEEYTTLSSILDRPKRPLIAILGGTKLKTKLPCLMSFLKTADQVMVAGLLAPVILAIKKIAISGWHFERGLEKEVEKLELTNPKLHLPIDALAGLRNLQEDYLRQTAVGKIRSEEQMFDIGPETVRMFSNIIGQAKTIVWNGPLGYIEDERFAGGTLAIASAVLRSPAFSVVGGGDINAFLAENNLRDKFGYVSTGGGAMLELLSGRELPGIKALEQNPRSVT